MNEKIEQILKAALSTSVGGQLSAENANQFIDLLVDMTDLLKRVEVRRGISAATVNIDTFGIAARQLQVAAEGSTLSEGVTFTVPRRTLSMVESALTPNVTKRWFEENIEGPGIETKLRTKFAVAVGNDLCDLTYNGDSDSGTTFLQQNNGLIDLAGSDSTVNSVDITGQGGNIKAALNLVMKGLPVKYRQRRAELAFHLSPDVFENYIDQIAERNTALGDSYLTGALPIYYKGILAYPGYTFPDGYIYLTAWKNIVVGFGRDITVEFLYQPRGRVYEYTITVKWDVNHAVGELISLGSFGS